MVPQSRSRIELIIPFTRKAFIVSAVTLALGFSSTAHGQAVKMTQLAQKIPTIIQTSQLVSHKAAADVLHIAVNLVSPNPAGLQAFADSVSNPKSPNYGKFATPAQLGQMFGQPQATVQSIVTYLQSKGFTIKLVAASRLSILADATVAQAESAFDTTINNYHSLKPKESLRTDFYSFGEPIQFPVATAPAVLGISGLDNLAIPRPLHKKLANARRKFNSAPLTPTQTRVLYNTAPIYNAGMQGAGKTLAISNWDGYRLTNVPLYYTKFNLPIPPGGVGSNITVVTIDGGSGAGTPGAEGDLDIQMVLGMAPLCAFRIYDGGGDLIDVLTKEQDDNLADVISESYGWDLSGDLSDATAAHNLHVLMTSQGMTYLAATGDYGTTLEPFAYSDYEPEVLKVGGTVADTDSQGNRTSEVGWSGSGGGWATEAVAFNVLPSWQKGNGVPTSINFRLVPDVALNAAGETTGAYQFYLNGALNFDYDGTSFASPVFAGSLGITELKIATLGGPSRMGRINDTFYAQNEAPNVWYDVTQGSNGTLPNGVTSNAGPFWDFVTGWGAINFAGFAQSVAVTPPAILGVSSIQAYKNTALSPVVTEGTSVTGGPAPVGKSVPYNLLSVLEPAIGRVATMQATFNASSVNSAKLTSLKLTVTGSAPVPATVMLYIYNQSTKAYELLTSLSGTQFGNSNVLTINGTPLSKYVSASGQIGALVRCLVPNSRSSQVPGNYVLKVNGLQFSAVQSLN